MEKKKPHLTLCMIDSCELIWESGLHQCQQFTVNRTHPESCWTERPSITAVIDGWTNHCLFLLSSSELRWFLQTDVFIHCRRPGPSDICNGGGDSWSICIQDLLVNVPSLALSHSYIQSMIVCDEMFVTFSSLFHSGLDLKKYF